MIIKRFFLLFVLLLTGCESASYPFAHEEGKERIIHAEAKKELDPEKLIQPPSQPELYVGIIEGLSPQDATKVRHRLQLQLAEAMIPLAVVETEAAFRINAACKIDKNDQETALVCTWKLAKKGQEFAEEKEIRHVIETNNSQFALDSLTILQTKEVVPFVQAYLTGSSIPAVLATSEAATQDQQATPPPLANVSVTFVEIKGLSAKQKKLLEGFLKTLLLQRKIDLVADAATYQIKGIIKITPSEGKDKVTMSWEMLANNTSLGMVSQENVIPKGQFTKIWQDQIYAIAQGITDGIVTLVDHQKKEQKKE